MLLRAGSDPRAVHWARGVSCGGCNEFVRCRTKRTVCTKGNGLEANVEALLLDDLVRAAVLGSGVRICASGTHLALLVILPREPVAMGACLVRYSHTLEHPKIAIDIYIPNQSPSKGSVPR